MVNNVVTAWLGVDTVGARKPRTDTVRIAFAPSDIEAYALLRLVENRGGASFWAVGIRQFRLAGTGGGTVGYDLGGWRRDWRSRFSWRGVVSVTFACSADPGAWLEAVCVVHGVDPYTSKFLQPAERPPNSPESRPNRRGAGRAPSLEEILRPAGGASERTLLLYDREAREIVGAHHLVTLPGGEDGDDLEDAFKALDIAPDQRRRLLPLRHEGAVPPGRRLAVEDTGGEPRLVLSPAPARAPGERGA